MEAIMKRVVLVITFVFAFAANMAFAQSIKDTLKTKSGLKYLIIKRGNGEKPWPGKQISIYYTIRFINGKQFDTNKDGDPFKVKLNTEELIPGLYEGLTLMTQGAKYKLIIPPALAYGKEGMLNPEGSPKFLVQPNTTLIYEVELVDFKR